LFIVVGYACIGVFAPEKFEDWIFGFLMFAVGVVFTPMVLLCCKQRDRADRAAMLASVGYGFDRAFIWLPFAIMSQLELHRERGVWWDRYVDTYATVLSFAHLALGAVEIDCCASNDVRTAIETDRMYGLQHLAMRGAESVVQVSFVIAWLSCIGEYLVAHVNRKEYGFIIFDSPIMYSACLLAVIALWLVNYYCLAVANNTSNMPKDIRRARFVVAFTALAFNPVFFLNSTGYARSTRRASRGFLLWNLIQLAAAMGIIICICFTDVLHLEELLRRGHFVVKFFKPNMYIVLLRQLCWSSLTFYGLLFFNPRLRSVVWHLVRSTGDSRMTLRNTDRRGLTEMASTTKMGVSQYVVSICSVGAMASMLPVGKVDTDEVVVESLLGSGGFGVVVRVRVEKRGSGSKNNMAERYALKLQSYADKATYFAAMRERQIYQRIWEETDRTTGRCGHQMIVKLECASEWPQGKQLFYENTGEPVRVGKVTKFHCALLMEYCPLGSLVQFMKNYTRRGIDNRQDECTFWPSIVKRFSAGVLSALDFLHNTKGLVYRDLKPDNVLIVGTTDNPYIKLADFGLSKAVDSPSTDTFDVVGTPYFRPPDMSRQRRSSKEHSNNGKEARERSDSNDGILSWLTSYQQQRPAPPESAADVFAFGMLLFVITYGCVPILKGPFGWEELDVQASEKNWQQLKDLRWILVDTCSSRPQPGGRNDSWSKALSAIASEPQCPNHAIGMIKQCTSLDALARPPVAQLKNSPLFTNKMLCLKYMPEFTTIEEDGIAI
jgi:serine/threonine protein kinase